MKFKKAPTEHYLNKIPFMFICMLISGNMHQILDSDGPGRVIRPLTFSVLGE